MQNSKALFVLLVLGIVLSFGSKAQQNRKPGNNEFKVYGTIKGLDFPMFIDYAHPETGERVWDTLHVENESFSYSANIKNTHRIAIWPMLAKKKEGERVGKQTRIEFLVRPGDAIEFVGKVTDDFEAQPTGSVLCDQINAFNKSIKYLDEKAGAIQKRAFAYKPGSDEFIAVLDSVKLVGAEISKMKIDFISSHPKSEVSAWYLSDLVMRKNIDDVEALKLFNQLDEELESCPFYIQVNTRLKGSEATKPGNMVPNVVTNRTLDGSEFDLSSTRGKYVLIDFWGTWCGPCVSEMPKVKEYSEKYKDELIIVGINSGDTKDRIKKFVESKGYEWIQLSSKKGESDDNFVTRFNVTGFPTKFIVSPDGKILHRFVGNAEEAFVKLDEIFENK